MFGIKKFYKFPLTNYDFGVAMGGLLLKLQNFKKVQLILGPLYFIANKYKSLTPLNINIMDFVD